ncbi:MAG: thrombospondin type 3 repeat-containing protein [Colwellia sp.]|nr:thrombospondin type 3 repeat-containing protein [Colwellia sp.]
MPSQAAEYSCISSYDTCEATGLMTDVYLEHPEFPSETNSDDFTWSNDVSEGYSVSLALGVHTITWTLTDNSNNAVVHTEEQTITIEDTTGPKFGATPEFTDSFVFNSPDSPDQDPRFPIDAHGLYTTITLEMLTGIFAYDLVDGPVEFTLKEEYRLLSGQHLDVVTLIATDSNGTSTEEVLPMGIDPLVSFGEDQLALIGDANRIEIPFFFSGKSHRYGMVMLEFSGSAVDKGLMPYSYPFMMYKLDELKGSIWIATNGIDLVDGDTLIVTFTEGDDYDDDDYYYYYYYYGNSYVNKPVDANEQLVITFTDKNVAPSTELNAYQGSDDYCDLAPLSKSASRSSSARMGCGNTKVPGTVFEKSDTETVTIEAIVTDINYDEFTFELTVDGIDKAYYVVELHDSFHGSRPSITLEFSPSDATANIVTAHLVITEVGTEELLQASADIQIVLTADTQPLNGDDTDGDGISDSDEGFDDTDGDGIPDYLDDAGTNRNVLAIGTNNDPMQTKPGLTLKLGLTKRAADGFSAADASVSQENLLTNGDNGAAPTSNNTVDEYSIPISPIVDFEVTGLAAGESIPVVIPLPNGRSLPRDAVYRKYTAEDGWKNFVSDANNSLSSASRDISELCPAADDDARYFIGLNAGHQCVRITIEDGGPNDADNTVNGTIVDPGVITVLTPPATPTTPAPEPITTTTTTTTTSSGGGSTGLLTLLLLPLIFFRKIKAKK